MDKALEAGAIDALRIAITTASNDDLSEAGSEKRKRHVARIDAMQTAIDALEAAQIKSALPATDTSGLVGIMRDKAAGRRNRVGDPWGDHLCAEAADRIEALERRLAEAEAVIRPFADIANAVFRVDDGLEMNATRKDDHAVWGFDRTELTFGHLRAARSYLEGRK